MREFRFVSGLERKGRKSEMDKRKKKYLIAIVIVITYFGRRVLSLPVDRPEGIEPKISFCEGGARGDRLGCDSHRDDQSSH